MVKEPNGNLHICADFKPGVFISKVYNDYFPLTAIETTFSNMAGMVWFAKIDLSKVYFQIKLEESSHNITIATPARLYCYKRLPMGLKSSPLIFFMSNGVCFQRFYKHNCLSRRHLLGVPTEESIDEKVSRAIQCLREKGMAINEDKSIFKTQVTFLGHEISVDGISTDPDLVQKIMDINANEL